MKQLLSNKNKYIKFFVLFFVFSFAMFYLFVLSFFYQQKNFFIKANASYTTYTYAQVKSDDTYLYKTPDNVYLQNAYFALPNTYFVMLLKNYDEYFYKVQYRDLVGYVLRNKVMPVKEKPKTPYLQNITFRVFSSDGTKVYTSPFDTQNQNPINQVEVYQTLDYYGFILGDEYIKDRGLTWYFAKSLTNTTQNLANSKNQISGYFYSGLCDSLPIIPPNTESVTPNNNLLLEEDTSFLFNLIDLSPFLKVLLVVLISLPCVGLIFLLFYPFKIQKDKLKNNCKNKFSRTKNTKSKDSKNQKTYKYKKGLKKEKHNLKTLQNFKNKRSQRKKQNVTINKIQKIIDDDIL